MRTQISIFEFLLRLGFNFHSFIFFQTQSLRPLLPVGISYYFFLFFTLPLLLAFVWTSFYCENLTKNHEASMRVTCLRLWLWRWRRSGGDHSGWQPIKKRNTHNQIIKQGLSYNNLSNKNIKKNKKKRIKEKIYIFMIIFRFSFLSGREKEGK